MIQFDSRLVKKGDVFVALKGLTHDGNDYIDEALKNGAVKIYENSNAYELGKIASDYFKNPSSKIKVIGVTGTKGKTTTCHLIHHILTSLDKKTGLISSITTSGFHTTTPDIITLNQELSKMVKKKFEFVVLEVSSHGITQGRISGINFYATVLTNIKPEHLDYHKNFNEYKNIKMLFYKSGKIRIKSPKKTKLNILQGEFNNINAETALNLVYELGFKNYAKNLKTLNTFKLPEGRLEEIINNKGFRIFVDFAHTPDSLEKALIYIKSLKPKHLISVFGCAGERDHKKRSKMGKISTQIADLSVFTAEDTRSENIFDILRQIRSNAVKDKYFSIPERGEAIAYALSIAKKGDIIGIFGKGHEKSMCYQNFEHPWSDQEMIKLQLNGRDDVSAVIFAAGKGTRMRSQRPKVLREICGRPILSYVLENLRKSGVLDIVLVVSFRKNEIMKRYPYSVTYAYQLNPKGGTGDALRSGISHIFKKSKYILGLYGDDSAFFRPETTHKVIDDHIKSRATITFVSANIINPCGLGRVLRNKNNEVVGIIEEKEANDEQKDITEVNCGHFVFNKDWLLKNIEIIRVSTTGEIYVVDLIKMAINEDKKVNVYKLSNDDEWHGVNTPEQLVEAEQKMIKRLNEKT